MPYELPRSLPKGWSDGQGKLYCIAYRHHFQEQSGCLTRLPFSPFPASCLHPIWSFFLEIPFESESLLFFCFLFVCFLNLRYNWHVTSRKFKIYTVDRILMYCNVIITVALADTFVMSHHCHFGGEAHCFEDILLWKSFFLSGWFYFTFF